MKLHFKLRGEDLTRIVRDLVLEEQWEHAVTTLVTGLQGISHDQAYAVLSGKQKLTGDETKGIGLADEDTAVTIQHQKNIDYLYSSYFWYDCKWYKPYAVVDSYGICDFMNAYEGLRANQNFYDDNNSWKRNIYYMNNKAKDLCHAITSQDAHSLLLEHVANPPVWMVEQLRHNTPQMSYDNYITTHHRIEIRGASVDARTREEVASFWNDRKTQKIVNLTDTKRRTITELNKLEDLTFKNGWILPDGRFYGCLYSDHINLADDILYVILGVESNDPGKQAENLGWLKVGHSMLENNSTYYFITKEATQAQKDKLFDWCSQNNESFPQHIEPIT